MSSQATSSTPNKWSKILIGFIGLTLLCAWLISLISGDSHASWVRYNQEWDDLSIPAFGAVGVWGREVILFMAGYSSIWWLLIGIYWLLYALFSTVTSKEEHSTVKLWLGIVFLTISSCLLESLYFRFLEPTLPSRQSGGAVAWMWLKWGLPLMGQGGSTVLAIGLFPLGLAWVFTPSWQKLSLFVGVQLDALGLKLQSVYSPSEKPSKLVAKRLVAERSEGTSSEVKTADQALPFHIKSSADMLEKEALGTFERPKEDIQEHLFTDIQPISKTKTIHPPTYIEEKGSALLAGALPTIQLLDSPKERVANLSPETLKHNSFTIEEKLRHYHVIAKVVATHPGPVVTRYEIEPDEGVKGNSIVNLAKDLARILKVVSIRVVETIPGKNYMALELPNPKRDMILLKEIIDSENYRHASSPLAMALGKDIVGNPVVADLAKMPHLLVAGTTGSGKSVGLSSMILSILFKASPQQVRFLMIDPKMLELSVYEGIGHLITPVITDMSKAALALRWCVAEMERRYKLMAHIGVRHITSYNDKVGEADGDLQPIKDPFKEGNGEVEVYLQQLPYIVVIIDELADLMMQEGKKIEQLIARLAQKARAAGIHLILATQRPSVDVITGLIKANIPTRIAFQVSSKIDSRTIIDQMGAEALLGMGDMLYLPSGTGVPTRVHGAFVSEQEVHRVVAYLRTQGEPEFLVSLDEFSSSENEVKPNSPLNPMTHTSDNSLYAQALTVLQGYKGRPSASILQRSLNIGYNRAASLMDELERNKVVSPMNTNGQRELLTPDKDKT